MGRAQNLSVDDVVSFYRYRPKIRIYAAKGHTVIVDSKSQRFADLGLPFGRSINVRDLADGIRRFQRSDIGKFRFRNAEDATRSLLNMPSEVAGPLALLLAAPSDVVPSRKIGPLFHLLSSASPNFLSKTIDFDSQLRSLKRLLDLLPPLPPSAFTPNPENPDVTDPTLPPFPIPQEIWPFQPIGKIFDPRTGFPIPWDQIAEEAKKNEKKLKEKKKKLDEMLQDLEVNVIAPAWLIDLLPDEDPNVPSSISISDNRALGVSSIDILKRWCDTPSDAFASAIEVDRTGIDVLIVADLEQRLKTDRELSDCLSSDGFIRSPIIHQIFGFYGLSLLTRTRFGGAWSPGHLAIALSSNTASESIPPDSRHPGERFVIEPPTVRCVCTADDQSGWIKKLSTGWLLRDQTHCPGSPGDDPRIRCAGTLETVSPGIEVTLPSLEVGAPSGPRPIGTTWQPGESRSGGLMAYCAVDQGFGCLRFPLYSFADKVDLERFVRDRCRTAWPDAASCNQLGIAFSTHFVTSSSSDRLRIQRSDLTAHYGAGLFAIPLKTLLFDIPAASDGTFRTRVLADAEAQAAGVEPNVFKALRERERTHALRIVPMRSSETTDAQMSVHDLLRQPNAYVKRLSVIVHRQKLTQLAISSYIRLLQSEWEPESGKSSMLVTLSQLRR